MAEGQVADPNKDNDYVGAKYGHFKYPSVVTTVMDFK